ncbi:hypothetical protein [Leptolyngbya ohadii]|uniref:hypothetical protein n=1 Tax=Leptolyngbya ohadii TaxID=1962290 RepID=UPI000B59E544|nr:hypothetical protein [Leptolyngbya ohadii]
MSFFLSTVILLASAVSPVAELTQLTEIFNRTGQDLASHLYQLNPQQDTLLDLQSKNPPCDPIRCY